MWCAADQQSKDSGQMLCHIVCDRVVAADDGSHWDLDIVYLPVFLEASITIPKQFGRPEA